MVAISVSQLSGKRNAFTTTGCNNLHKSTLEMHQNSKDHILSISDLKLRRSFQATVSNAKKNIDTDQTLEITRRQIVQLKTVYPMNKNDISADNFIRRNPKMCQRFPGICNSANLRTLTVPSGTLNLWLKEP